MLPKVHPSENGDRAISARPQYGHIRLKAECAVAPPPPRRLQGMRGDDKTADAGRGAHCAVRHGSSSNGAGSVGGRAPLFEEKNWLLSKSWQTASQTAISQRRKRRRSASGSVHQCVFFVFFAARGVVQVFSCAECDVLSVHATSIVSQTGT
eukprot:COSAG01_NODE_25100_length_755_cov_10.422256_2_plen_151_part_01